MWEKYSLELSIALGSIVGGLLAGKTIRRLVLLPFEWLSSWTSNKADDILVDEARKDLGIETPTIEAEKESDNAGK